MPKKGDFYIYQLMEDKEDAFIFEASSQRMVFSEIFSNYVLLTNLCQKEDPKFYSRSIPTCTDYSSDLKIHALIQALSIK